jgi:hypothetical protein
MLDTLVHFSTEDYEILQVQAEPVYHTEKLSSGQVRKSIVEKNVATFEPEPNPFGPNNNNYNFINNNNDILKVAEETEPLKEKEKESENEKANSETNKNLPINPINELGFLGAMGNIVGCVFFHLFSVMCCSYSLDNFKRKVLVPDCLELRTFWTSCHTK